MKIILPLLVLLISIAPTSLLHAQDVGPDEVVKINTSLVSIPVVVNDRQGRYIPGLKARTSQSLMMATNNR